MDTPKSETSGPTPAVSATQPPPAKGALAYHKGMNKADRVAMFAAAAKGKVPDEKGSATDAIHELHTELLEYRKKGFSHAQLAEMLQSMGVRITPPALRKLMRPYESAAPATVPTVAAKPAAKSA